MNNTDSILILVSIAILLTVFVAMLFAPRARRFADRKDVQDALEIMRGTLSTTRKNHTMSEMARDLVQIAGGYREMNADLNREKVEACEFVRLAIWNLTVGGADHKYTVSKLKEAHRILGGDK